MIRKKPDVNEVTGLSFTNNGKLRKFFLLATLRCPGSVFGVLDYNLFFGVVDKLCAVLGDIDFRLCHEGLLYRLINRSLS